MRVTQLIWVSEKLRLHYLLVFGGQIWLWMLSILSLDDLPDINRYNALMVIVDKFGKLNRLVPCRAGEGQLTAPQVA